MLFIYLDSITLIAKNVHCLNFAKYVHCLKFAKYVHCLKFSKHVHCLKFSRRMHCIKCGRCMYYLKFVRHISNSVYILYNVSIICIIISNSGTIQDMPEMDPLNPMERNSRFSCCDTIAYDSTTEKCCRESHTGFTTHTIAKQPNIYCCGQGMTACFQFANNITTVSLCVFPCCTSVN